MRSLRAQKPARVVARKEFGQQSATPVELWPPEILVVEDGSGIFPTIGALLQGQGFQVILAPDADSALKEIGHDGVAAVIAGASPEQEHGLDLLGAVKALRAEVKTLVVTQLLNPALPTRAYEMDIDDYLHWPLTGTELSNRLRGLLGQKEEFTAPGKSGATDTGHQNKYAVDLLLTHCSQMLCRISQTVQGIRTKHREGMSPELGQELKRLAVLIQSLGGGLGRSQAQADTAAPPAPRCACSCH